MSRAYALFWWLVAAGWTMWNLVEFTLARFVPSMVHGVICFGTASVRLYDRASGKLRGIISDGEPGGLTLDPSGRYLLMARGSPTRTEWVDDGKAMSIIPDPSYELVRVDLQPRPGAATPTPLIYPMDVTMLGLPEKVLWKAKREVHGLAW